MGMSTVFFATLLLWLLVTLVPCTLPLLLLELGKDLRSRWDAVPNMSRFGWVFTVAAAMMSSPVLLFG